MDPKALEKAFELYPDVKVVVVANLYGTPGKMDELCAICEEDKANISRSLKYLEQEGYITSSPRRRRRYHCILELTDKGREVASKLAMKIDSMLERASEGLSEADRVIMYRSLTLISNNLQKIYENYETAEESAEDGEDEA